ncbi:cryptochrome/photolyase family protein [Pantoea sp. 1.19]|uniref:cryptochrome/photolyase family protein n=1 Tax=Pantoea sp. 1.19 TaxID=1925589 RepID=UPI000948CFE0|nr:cryptochrome/photolyase family protein [Pantoea sp. 1.19]
MTELRLILGDQLNPQHSWFSRRDKRVIYLLLELQQETAYVKHHAQKVLAIFAAMRDFARQLKAQGHRVRYVKLGDAANRGSLTDNLDALITHYQAERVSWQEPDEWRLDRQLRDWASQHAVATHCVSSEHFFTDRDEVGTFFDGRKSWRMEHFYRHMRRQFRILLQDDDTPVGQQWNFDKENRKRWPGQPAAPSDRRPHADRSALWQEIVDQQVVTFGDPQAERFRWPLNRDQALAQLDHFIQQVLPEFGHWQDAMHRGEHYLFHSLLSFALNSKMLTPGEVVDRAEQAWRAGRAPLAACEGFIRQILGWREYVRGIYWAKMPAYRELNVFDNQQPLPDWFWTGKTRMRCLAESIGQSLSDAYAHHIQRLMVIGNFSLLAGLSPQAVHEWYLGVYIDAFEWVELPNTLGMSQFADGGLLASKPYVSSAAYINKMSNYCQSCHYAAGERTGDRACPFNALYWDFFARQRDWLENNARLPFVWAHLDKMSEEERQAMTARAAQLRDRLDSL